jgi:TonB family protein
MDRTFLFLLLSLIATTGASADERSISNLTPQQQSELAYQTEKVIAAYPRLGGFLDLSIAVAPSGKVRTVDVIRNRTRDLTLETQILERVYGWEFTPAESGQKPLTIEQRIAFSQQVDGGMVLYTVMAVLGLVTVWWILMTPSQQ